VRVDELTAFARRDPEPAPDRATRRLRSSPVRRAVQIGHAARVSIELWQRPPLALIGWLLLSLTLGELRLVDRLLYRDPGQYAFVLANVTGVLEGRLASKSWAQRKLAPWMIAGLERVTVDRLHAMRVFQELSWAVANVLLLALALRAGHARWRALGIVAAFGFAHLLLLYRLEYPWDGVDSWLFLLFGALVARSHELRYSLPLLPLGVLNHETILYLPLWYLLEPLAPTAAATSGRGRWLRWLVAAALFAACLGAILALRAHWYVGRPDWPGQKFEEALPLVDNPWHFKHNLKQLAIRNWRELQVFFTLGWLSTIAACALCLRHADWRRPAVWTLVVLASVMGFGYVNESRLYLPLISFWFAYASCRPRVVPARE
jgi:hypothetical protein